MKKTLLIFTVALLLVSCASKNQKAVLDEVARVYNAKTGFSKGFNKTAGKASITYFKIKLSESDIIESMETNHAAANIAVMLYNNFTDEERKEYTHIEVAITRKDSSDKTTKGRIFTIAELKAPGQQAKLFDSFAVAVVNQNYNLAANLIDSQYRKPTTTEEMKSYLSKKIEKQGKIKEFKRTGFALRTVDENKHFVFSGFFIFEDNKELPCYVETYNDPELKYLYNFHID